MSVTLVLASVALVAVSIAITPACEPWISALAVAAIARTSNDSPSFGEISALACSSVSVFSVTLFAENAAWSTASSLIDLSLGRASRYHFLAFFHVFSTGY